MFKVKKNTVRHCMLKSFTEQKRLECLHAWVLFRRMTEVDLDRGRCGLFRLGLVR